MRKLYILGLVSLAALIIGLAWAQEQITLTTYYPAPYGVYKQLRLNPTDDFTPYTDCTGYAGAMYYDNTDNQMFICDGITNLWQPIAGGTTYRLVERNTFNSGNEGWSTTVATSRTTFNGQTILGGYNSYAGAGSANQFSKNFDLTGISHTEVLIRLEYYAIDSWDNEWAYIREGNLSIWNHQFWYDDGAINVGGNASWRDRIYFAEGRVPHTGNTLSLTVGSTLDSGATDESFGIDNVEVWVR